ncbi:MAG: hypothetical protein ACI80K_004606 [Paracoccaceae bacterium]|jgi:hypothetical protein
MQRSIIASCTLVLASFLGACSTADKGVWDNIDARAAGPQPGRPSLDRPAASPFNPGATTQVADSSFGPAPGIPVRMYAPLLPRNAAPSPEVAGLAFLTGRWVAVNPNDTVNEETWTPPRGNVLIGSFRQIRLDGDCSIVDVTQIAQEGDELLLRLRNLNGRLEVPEGRGEISLFRLVSLEKDRVEFTGTTGAEGVTSLVYHRKSATELDQEIGFAPENGREPIIIHYHLDR